VFTQADPLMTLIYSPNDISLVKVKKLCSPF
jgi:hypothetical protein